MPKLVGQIQKDPICERRERSARSARRGELRREHHRLLDNRVDEKIGIHFVALGLQSMNLVAGL
jgi:hypothetical protein